MQAAPWHVDLPLRPFPCAQGASISQFDVRDVVWQENLGGEHLELGERSLRAELMC